MGYDHDFICMLARFNLHYRVNSIVLKRIGMMGLSKHEGYYAMKRQYNLIVFDWEGTIAEDSLGQVIHLLAQVAKRLHFGEFDKTLARRYITLGFHGAVRQLFPHLPMYQQE